MRPWRPSRRAASPISWWASVASQGRIGPSHAIRSTTRRRVSSSIRANTRRFRDSPAPLKAIDQGPGGTDRTSSPRCSSLSLTRSSNATCVNRASLKSPRTASGVAWSIARSWSEPIQRSVSFRWHSAQTSRPTYVAARPAGIASHHSWKAAATVISKAAAASVRQAARRGRDRKLGRGIMLTTTNPGKHHRRFGTVRGAGGDSDPALFTRPLTGACEVQHGDRRAGKWSERRRPTTCFIISRSTAQCARFVIHADERALRVHDQRTIFRLLDLQQDPSSRRARPTA